MYSSNEKISTVFLTILLTIIIFVFSQNAISNDTMATISSEEIKFVPTNDINLEEEVLKISPDEIEVNYVFYNHSDKEIVTDVAFPLPAVPVLKGDTSNIFPSWDEAYLANRFILDNPGTSDKNVFGNEVSNLNFSSAIKNAPFINFARTVNGLQYGYNYRIIAKTYDGKDITKLLIDNDIPISATYISGFMEESPLSKKPVLKKKLIDLQLLDEEGKPIWQNQTIYYWKQSFKPKEKTIVSHKYRPAVGQYWLEADNPKKIEDVKFYTRDIDKKEWKNYCLSELDQERLLSYFKNGKTLAPAREIQYILTTANNWHGPIKKFKLEINNPNNDIVSFCWPGKVKVNVTDNNVIDKQVQLYSSEINDFVPKNELKIIFIGKPPEGH